MLPFQFVEGGSFTSDGALNAFDVRLSDEPDVFVIRNRTYWASGVPAAEAQWFKGMSAGDAQLTAGGNLASGIETQNGFTFVDVQNPPIFEPLTASAISCTGAWEATMADTGNIDPGDWVRVYDATDALQISGYSLQVSAVTKNTSITFGYVANSTLALLADATTSQIQKYIPNNNYPRWNYISNIVSSGSTTNIYFTGSNDFTVGQNVTFIIPKIFGMKELNNKSAKVVFVANYTFGSSFITVQLDTSGFNSFTFPVSADAAPGAGFSPALVIPSSSGIVNTSATNYPPAQPPGTNLKDAFDNRNRYYMHMGKEIIFDTDPNTFDWYAYKFDKKN